MKIERPLLLLLALTALSLGAAESDLRLFDTVWENVCRRHYDPDFAAKHRDLHDRYRPRVAAAETSGEAALLINQMLAETGESHLALLPPKPDVPETETAEDAIPFDAGNLRLSVKYEAERLSETVGLLRFSIFVPEVVKRFRQDLNTRFAGCRGIVIDLRGNPGGVMETAKYLASWCTPERIGLGTMTIDGTPLAFRSAPQKGCFQGKIAILIDSDSCSTAEIFAAAMQDAGAARLFGAASPGKCLPSLIVPMPDGSRLQLAFGDVRRANGDRIEGVGVTPDEPCSDDEAVEKARQWIDEKTFFEEIFTWWN